MIIRNLVKTDFDDLESFTTHQDPYVVWKSYIHEQESGERVIHVVEINKKVIGIGTLKFVSEYPFFSQNNIPEISDVIVEPQSQSQGVGRALITSLEKIAKNAGYSIVGLGVGLYRDYGRAQRLYTKMGYIPDGNGVTYKCESAIPGEAYLLDDDFILWLIKKL